MRMLVLGTEHSRGSGRCASECLECDSKWLEQICHRCTATEESWRSFSAVNLRGKNQLSSLNEHRPWSGASWAKTSVRQPATEEVDVKEMLYSVWLIVKNTTRHRGFFWCVGIIMQWVGYQRRWEEKERGGCVFYRRRCCEAMKPPIDKRGLIRGSSGERKVSEVSPHNRRRIHRLFAAKTESRFLYFSFPFHPLTVDPSLFCLLLPVLRLLPLILSHAAEGFAPSELRCYLNRANKERKKK